MARPPPSQDAAAPPAQTPAAQLRAMAEAQTGKLDTRVAPRDANHSFGAPAFACFAFMRLCG